MYCYIGAKDVNVAKTVPERGLYDGMDQMSRRKKNKVIEAFNNSYYVIKCYSFYYSYYCVSKVLYSFVSSAT